MMLSPMRRSKVLNALRNGAVPEDGLDLLAVGYTPQFVKAIDEMLEHVGAGGGAFKAIRGEYGTGKTFTVRWIEERARQMGFATAEVQISETETPLHKLHTIYRRAMEHLATESMPDGAFQNVVDSWLYRLERDVEDLHGSLSAHRLEQEITGLMEKRLANVSKHAPQFAAALRGYQDALARSDYPTATGLLAWLAGQPNIGQGVKKHASLTGAIDHSSALSFLEGLLTVLRDSGHKGLVLVLDEVETLQRARSDSRERSLNALRQLIDYVADGRYPGLCVIITGTPSFFDGPLGVQRLAPLAQRLDTKFSADPRFDNPRAAQVRLKSFDRASLVELGQKIRRIYADGSEAGERVRQKVDDAYLNDFIDVLLGDFGAHVGLAPRIFLKKLVDLMDRVEQFPDFDPRVHYDMKLSPNELSAQERAILDGTAGVDDIELDMESEDEF